MIFLISHKSNRMAENVAVKLVKKDNLLKYNSKNHVLYSNQFIPLLHEADVFERIRLQGLFDSHFSGGASLHVNIETPIRSKKVYQNLIEYCARSGVVYWSPNYNIQDCVNGHVLVGKNTQCPVCRGEIANNYTRIVGYLTPVKNWGKERREIDYPNRKFYKELSVDEDSKDTNQSRI